MPNTISQRTLPEYFSCREANPCGKTQAVSESNINATSIISPFLAEPTSSVWLCLLDIQHFVHYLKVSPRVANSAHITT